MIAAKAVFNSLIWKVFSEKLKNVFNYVTILVRTLLLRYQNDLKIVGFFHIRCCFQLGFGCYVQSSNAIAVVSLIKLISAFCNLSTTKSFQQLAETDGI